MNKSIRKHIMNKAFLDDEWRNSIDLELAIAEDDYLEYGVNPPYPIKSIEDQEAFVRLCRLKNALIEIQQEELRPVGYYGKE